MKRFVGMVLLVAVFSICLSFTGCKATQYVATTTISKSNDGGETYGSGKMEFQVGKKCYVKVLIKVESTSSKTEEIGVDIVIPILKNTETYLMKGQNVTEKVDEKNKTYHVIIPASKNSVENEFVFQFDLISKGNVSISITYDDKIPTSSDVIDGFVIV